jgi:hypothetical protein
MISSAWTRTGRGPADERDTPLGVGVAVGALVVVVAAFVAAAVPPSAAAVRLGLFAAALGVFAALMADPLAVAIVGVLGFGIFNGFLVNQLGELTWHGRSDVSRVLVLAAAGVSGVAVGQAYRAVRRARLWRGRQRLVTAWTAGWTAGWTEEWTEEERDV